MQDLSIGGAGAGAGGYGDEAEGAAALGGDDLMGQSPGLRESSSTPDSRRFRYASTS